MVVGVWAVAAHVAGSTSRVEWVSQFHGNQCFLNPVSAASHPKSNNVGAIAGGVVGGLAVLCLFVLALAFLILRYRRPLRVVQPADADGRSSTLIPVPAPAELSPLSARAELSTEKAVGGVGVELDGKPQE